VYGALMWSLGKVFKSPEVCKVIILRFTSWLPGPPATSIADGSLEGTYQ